MKLATETQSHRETVKQISAKEVVVFFSAPLSFLWQCLPTTIRGRPNRLQAGASMNEARCVSVYPNLANNYAGK
jgi:hypothetical protein